MHPHVSSPVSVLGVRSFVYAHTYVDPAMSDAPACHLSGIGPEFLGRVRLGSSIASLAGVWIFQNFLKEIKISQVLFWTNVAAVPLGFTQVNVMTGGLPTGAFERV